MKPNYSKLDDAILEYIRSGSPMNPVHAEMCRKACDVHVGITISQIIFNRLKALRKAGKIRHVKPSPLGAEHGWVIVEPPTDA